MNKELLAQFGQRVKRLRETRGYSQQTLALKINLPVYQLARIEAGDLNVTLRTLQDLADGLDIALAELVDVNS